jgi:uncharacterized membrane protein YgaE (UPF0421/DUF939 family)
MQPLSLIRINRLQGRLWPILQTAIAATVAWYLAVLLLPDPRPSFASIAAVIAVGAAHGRRAGRAAQLIGGVVLGVAVADLIVQAIGSGPWQAGIMVVLAMGTAVALGGRDLLVAEAAVSAILIALLEPAPGFSFDRVLEGVVGGGVALAVALDFRVMARDAHMRVPEIGLGMNMSWQSVPRMLCI